MNNNYDMSITDVLTSILMLSHGYGDTGHECDLIKALLWPISSCLEE